MTTNDDWLAELQSLLSDEPDRIARAANASALIFARVADINWAGFYFLQETTLVLGPFQGQPACTRIAMGAGVCGTAALRRQTLVVEDVHDFPGHIACDAASRSEMVVPLIIGNVLIGVLDVDSPTRGRFGTAEREALEMAAKVFLGI